MRQNALPRKRNESMEMEVMRQEIRDSAERHVEALVKLRLAEARLQSCESQRSEARCKAARIATMAAQIAARLEEESAVGKHEQGKRGIEARSIPCMPLNPSGEVPEDEASAKLALCLETSLAVIAKVGELQQQILDLKDCLISRGKRKRDELGCNRCTAEGNKKSQTHPCQAEQKPSHSSPSSSSRSRDVETFKKSDDSRSLEVSGVSGASLL